MRPAAPEGRAATRALHDRVVAYGAILLTGFFGLVSYGRLGHDAREAARGDALQYIAMSERTFAPADEPFAFRLMTPWLVRQASELTGVAPDTVWLALTFLATTAALVVVYEWLRGPLGLSAATGLLSVLLLAVTYKYTSYNYGNLWLVDPLNNLFSALALYLAFRRKLALFTLVVAVGFVNKEAVLLLAPLYPLLAWARSGTLRDRAVWWGVAANAALAAAYLVFRAWVQGHIGEVPTHLAGDVTDLMRTVLSSRRGGEHLAVFSVLQFLWVVFAFGLYQQYRRFGLRSELLVASAFVLATCMFSRTQATDTERVYVMVAPLVVGVVGVVFEAWRDQPERAWPWVLGAVYAALNFMWVVDETASLVNLAAIAGFALLVQRCTTRAEGDDVRWEQELAAAAERAPAPGDARESRPSSAVTARMLLRDGAVRPRV